MSTILSNTCVSFRLTLCYLFMASSAFSGCKEGTGISQSKYAGVWESPPGENTFIESEYGPLKATLTLSESGLYELKQEIIGSPGGDGALTMSGKYSVNGNTIIADGLGKPGSASIYIENELLVIKNSEGSTTYYHRRSPQGKAQVAHP